MSARLHVLLGPGGVGKTTLAAGYAQALARSGRRVGLLGIDPSRRLQSALGLELPDRAVAVPGHAGLSAALLRPADCLRRWAEEECPDPDARERLTHNTFFLALADRLAGASDLLAAVRVAEWIERDAELDDLVVDTAPGLNALEFLRRPKALVAFMEGRIVGWLRWLARGQTGAFAGLVRGGAKRVLGALARIGGTNLVLELAEFLLLVEDVFEKLSVRLEHAQRAFVADSTEILLVAAVREDTPTTLLPLARALAEVGIAPSAVVLNRALPEHLASELGVLDLAALEPELGHVVQFARGYAAMQSRVVDSLGSIAPVAVVPAARGLDGPDRSSALETLGVALARALDVARAPSAPPPARRTAEGGALAGL